MTFEQGVHRITKKEEGIGNGSTLQAVCSCGWEGIKYPGYEDYQWTDCEKDARRHLKWAPPPNQPRPTAINWGLSR